MCSERLEGSDLSGDGLTDDYKATHVSAGN